VARHISAQASKATLLHNSSGLSVSAILRLVVNLRGRQAALLSPFI
jgi:hypothetical protein